MNACQVRTEQTGRHAMAMLEIAHPFDVDGSDGPTPAREALKRALAEMGAHASRMQLVLMEGHRQPDPEEYPEISLTAVAVAPLGAPVIDLVMREVPMEQVCG